MSTMPQLLYFDIRGRADPIRLLLEDAGVQYEDKQVTLETWPAIRDTTPFRRMPVYREGDLEIPETFAILRYLGRKFDLLGEDEISRVRCDVAIEAWRDYGNRVANVFGALSHSETARKEFIETEQPMRLRDLESFYLNNRVNNRANNPANGSYWAGDCLTVADFAAFHLIERIANQFPELLARFAGLREFHENFAARPRIKAYLSSSRRPEALFYGPNGKIFPKV